MQMHRVRLGQLMRLTVYVDMDFKELASNATALMGYMDIVKNLNMCVIT